MAKATGGVNLGICVLTADSASNIIGNRQSTQGEGSTMKNGVWFHRRVKAMSISQGIG